MNTHCLRHSLVAMTAGLLLMNTAWAGIPVWTFAPVPGYPSSVSLMPSETATIQYTVTNQSHKFHTLMMKPVQGITASGCASTLGYHQSCTLTLTVVASALKGDVFGGPALCDLSNSSQCYQPSQANSLAIRLLQASEATLTPSLTSLTLSAVTPRQARRITITNNGPGVATGVSINYPSWPGGIPATSASDNCGSTLPSGSSCTITITPGSEASSDGGANPCTTGTEPVPSIITVTGANASQAEIGVVVLGYGCQYQAGYVFAIDDSTPDAGSVGGKVLSLQDQTPQYPNGIIWSSNGIDGTSPNVVYDSIWGIAVGSTESSPLPNATTPPLYPATLVDGQLNCNGRYDGKCNSNNILVFYSLPNTDPAITLSYYAAGRCKAYTAGGFDDWYLPAICEFGPTISGSPACIPGTPNIADNLPGLVGQSSTPNDCTFGANCLYDGYWSSTEFQNNPRDSVWVEGFDGGGFQAPNNKSIRNGVRCVRQF